MSTEHHAYGEEPARIGRHQSEAVTARLRLFEVLAGAGVAAADADVLVTQVEAGAVAGAHTWISESSAPHGSEQAFEEGDADERASRTAAALSDGYGCWIPGGSEETAFLKELHRWLGWQVLRLDLWCGPEGAEGMWASRYGTLDDVGEGEPALKPGGQHPPARVPLNQVERAAPADNAHRRPYNVGRHTGR